MIVSWTSAAAAAFAHSTSMGCYRPRSPTQQHRPSPRAASLLSVRGHSVEGDGTTRPSPFVASRWIHRLNFGLEPGSFMPRRFPEWASSGARLGIPVELCFTDDRYSETVPESVRAKFDDELLPLFRVKISPGLNSTFVSERGQEHVSFLAGGYLPGMERR